MQNCLVVLLIGGPNHIKGIYVFITINIHYITDHGDYDRIQYIGVKCIIQLHC